jgi:hypothetical protein
MMISVRAIKMGKEVLVALGRQYFTVLLSPLRSGLLNEI